jgi:hypothetical protein
MLNEFLSICIPTRNRSHLLRDLLCSLDSEIATAKLTPDDVRIYVSDNASTDDTCAIAHKILGKRPHFTYWCNEQNVGAVGNVLVCAAKLPGQYQWIIGDDECVVADTLPYLLAQLREQQPGWFIHSDGQYGRALKPPRTFAAVDEFVRIAASDDPGVLMTAGTISLNTFRSDCFDHALAQSLEPTSTYAHFYGLMSGLQRAGASVILTDRHTIVVRPTRPRPSDGELPANSDRNWLDCMQWLKNTFNLPQLDPEIQSRVVSQEWLRQLRSHPWQTLRNNLALFLIFGTYPRVFKRLWYLLKR